MDNYIFRCNPTVSDLERVKSILESSGFFTEDEVKMGVSLLQERLDDLEHSSYEFVFLENENGIVGYTCFGFIEGTEASYDLYWIAVDQGFKRNGFGSMLLQETENQIKDKGGKKIYIETSSTPLYKPTRLFYEKSEYKKEAEIKDFYRPGDNKLIYSKTM
jgi:ribosomal protein S18 acetylase RimI-like enzyme